MPFSGWMMLFVILLIFLGGLLCCFLHIGRGGND